MLAADAHAYVDDLRGTGPTSHDAWQISSVIAKTASFYGVQDAARKRREQTQRPGVWAGVVCGTAPDRPFISVTWEKTKREVARLIKPATCSSTLRWAEHTQLCCCISTGCMPQLTFGALEEMKMVGE